MHNPLVQDPKPSTLTKQVHHVQQPALQPFTWIRYSHPMYTDMHMLTTARHGGDSLCTGHEKHMVPMTLTPVYAYKLKPAGTMYAALQIHGCQSSLHALIGNTVDCAGNMETTVGPTSALICL